MSKLIRTRSYASSMKTVLAISILLLLSGCTAVEPPVPPVILPPVVASVAPQVRAISFPLVKAGAAVAQAATIAKALTSANVDAQGPALRASLSTATQQIDLTLQATGTAQRAVTAQDKATVARDVKIAALVAKVHAYAVQERHAAINAKVNGARMFKFEAMAAVGLGVVVFLGLMGVGLMWYLSAGAGIMASVVVMFLFASIESYIPYVVAAGGLAVAVAFGVHWYESGSVKAALVPKSKRKAAVVSS